MSYCFRRLALRKLALPIAAIALLVCLAACGGSSANAATGVTPASAAGTYYLTTSSSFITGGNTLCHAVISGAITLTSSGTYSFSLNPSSAHCLSGTTATTVSVAGAAPSGTFTVASNGFGQLTPGTTPTSGVGGGAFQLSRNLDTMIIQTASPTQMDFMTALRL